MSDQLNDQNDTGKDKPQDASDKASIDAILLAQNATENVFRESKERYINEGAKGLILINGAGAAALLALLQAIWGKHGAAAFSEFVLWGAGSLLIGVAFAASIFMFRHRAFVKGAHNDEHPLYRWTHWYVPTLSIAAFVFGSALTIYGGLKHFPPDMPEGNAPTKAETLPVKPSPPLKAKN